MSNSQRQVDMELLDSVRAGRTTLTEKALIDSIESSLSDIVNHYILTPEERIWVSSILQSPARRDSVEEILGRVYTICVWMHKGWHGYSIPNAETANDWLSEVVQVASRFREKNWLQGVAIDLSALGVYISLWAKEKE